MSKSIYYLLVSLQKRFFVHDTFCIFWREKLIMYNPVNTNKASLVYFCPIYCWQCPKMVAKISNKSFVGFFFGKATNSTNTDLNFYVFTFTRPLPVQMRTMPLDVKCNKAVLSKWIGSVLMERNYFKNSAHYKWMSCSDRKGASRDFETFVRCC